MMAMGSRPESVFAIRGDGRPQIELAAAPVYAFGHLIRETETLLLKLFEQGLLSGTTHTAIGQEICQMSVVRALDRPADCALSNHRNHGHFLTYSGNFSGLLAEIMGREAGVCGGRGGSQHIAWRRFHSNGVQGGMTAIGVGHALAIQRRGDDGVVASFIGDGTLGQGLLYEAMNLASIWKLPLLFVVEHNTIAQTTPTCGTTGGDPIGRAHGFGLRTWRLDDADPAFLSDAAGVVQQMRDGAGAGMLVIDTRRLGPHSKGDDLRPADEIEAIRLRDPLSRIGGQLDRAERKQIEARNRAYLAEALDAAQASPESRFETRPVHVFQHTPKTVPASAAAAVPGNWRASLNAALRRLLTGNAEVIVLGEDLHEPYGGAFKVTAGLSSEFAGRVVSTPISEAGIVGTAIGLALDGFRPIVEVMFADFVTLAFDQLYNHAVKFSSLEDGIQVGMVIRTPAGGRRGYGPTHSQNPENFLCSIPGVTLLAPSHRHDPGHLLETACLYWPYPTVLLEHKLLYGKTPDRGGYRELPADSDDAGASLFPTLVRGGDDPDLTIVSFGGMAPHVEEAAQILEDEEELSVEILLPALISPLPRRSLLAHAAGRKRILIAEESHSQFGVSAEIAATLAENGFTGRLARLGTPPVPIPSARSLELQVIPGAKEIVAAALALFRD